MNSDLLKRLFRAINQNNSEAIQKIAISIIESEREKGHVKLAEQLENLLSEKVKKVHSLKEATNNKIHSLIVNSNTSKSLIELPTSKRNNQPLLSFIPHEKLRHHMVLPSEIEDRFKRIEKEYAARTRLAQYNLTPRKKILLYGSSGCGKTMGAERLAWNVGLPLLKVRFDSLISSYFGESASNLRTIFDTTLVSPCVLLLDECDFIASARYIGKDVGEIPRIVNMLLQLLDEYDSPGLLIATTNLENILDKAIFRRFDEVLEIPKPSKTEIEKILKMTLSAIELEKNISWSELVSSLEGFSAANIVKVAENAAKLAVLSGENKVSNKHLETSVKEIVNI